MHVPAVTSCGAGAIFVPQMNVDSIATAPRRELYTATDCDSVDQGVNTTTT
jgi:hypothetical protein